jgi:hypothetical protein
MFGEVPEVLGVEGREGQAKGWAHAAIQVSLAGLGRPRWIAAAEIRPQVLATSSL